MRPIFASFLAILCLASLAAAANRRTPIVDAVERVAPAVVNISTERVTVRRPFTSMRFDAEMERYFERMFRPRRQTQRSLGSGAIIDPEGFVVTNHHVVAAATKITVTLVDANGEERTYEARHINSDPKNDIALLKIEGGPFPYVEIARVDDLLIGETVIAVGNPIGLGHTVTTGVLSAKGRSLALSRDVRFEDLLQTDASINPGNSGGPLLDIDGRLIGVNTAIVRYAQGASIQGIGFAIPASRVRTVLDDLIDYEKLENLWLGFDPRPGRDAVVRVEEIAPDGPAKKAGLQDGDVIVGLMGRPVRSLFEFKKRVLGREKGDVLELAVRRGDETIQARLTVAEVPVPEVVKRAWERLGVAIAIQTVRLPEPTGWRQGVGILGVRRGGPAHRVGLQRGDVLTEIAGRRLDRLADLVEVLRDAPDGARIGIKVWRGSEGRMEGKLKLD